MRVPVMVLVGVIMPVVSMARQAAMGIRAGASRGEVRESRAACGWRMRRLRHVLACQNLHRLARLMIMPVLQPQHLTCDKPHAQQRNQPVGEDSDPVRRIVHRHARQSEDERRDEYEPDCHQRLQHRAEEAEPYTLRICASLAST